MKLRALLLGLLLAFSMTAAGQRLSRDEVDLTCDHWARTYVRIAEFRDNKIAKAALEGAVKRALDQGKIEEGYAKALLDAIRAVYANPDMSPADIGSLVHEKCVADLTSIKA